MADRRADFSALLEPELDALWRFAERMCWEGGTAEDCVQEAVLTAWRKFEAFSVGTNFRAWVFRILVNTIFNANNSLRRRLRVTDRGADLDLVAALEREEAYEHVLADPERVLSRVSDELRGAVKSLPQAERMVFLLRAIEGFSYREIADTLEIPMGTVMSHLFRARARLREFLADHVRESGSPRRVPS
ncbi:MAG: sigma-70 family RNA polymerase sigma factor [Planctomycetes bacterium]|nr:sigma-70 family RNA polymerase sigma factor [Planctomycetota bacterium]